MLFFVAQSFIQIILSYFPQFIEFLHPTPRSYSYSLLLTVNFLYPIVLPFFIYIFFVSALITFYISSLDMSAFMQISSPFKLFNLPLLLIVRILALTFPNSIRPLHFSNFLQFFFFQDLLPSYSPGKSALLPSTTIDQLYSVSTLFLL